LDYEGLGRHPSQIVGPRWAEIARGARPFPHPPRLSGDSPGISMTMDSVLRDMPRVSSWWPPEKTLLVFQAMQDENTPLDLPGDFGWPSRTGETRENCSLVNILTDFSIEFNKSNVLFYFLKYVSIIFIQNNFFLSLSLIHSKIIFHRINKIIIQMNDEPLRILCARYEWHGNQSVNACAKKNADIVHFLRLIW